MRKPIFALIALAFSLFGTQCWAQSCGEEEGHCFTFNPSTTPTSQTYDFGADGKLVVQFQTVLRSFDLRVGIHLPKPTDSTVTCESGPCPTLIPLDPKEFPSGTLCVNYGTSTPGQCDQYDFTGNAGGPNGVPVKNTDYRGLITLTLSYLSSQIVHNPAFGHAPGDNSTAVYSEDILTSYSTEPSSDPTMSGSLPGLSSVAAFDEPFTEIGDQFCSLTVNPTNVSSGQKPQEEVALKIASGACSLTVLGIRDKTARLSVWTFDTNGNVVFPALKNVEGNKFHWDNKNGLNEYDFSTEGLVSGQTYTVTVFSSKISPQSKDFVAP